MFINKKYKYILMKSKRKNIQVKTLKRVEEFLSKQKKPVFKAEIVKLGVDRYSLDIALTMIKHKVDKKGRIYLK